MDPAMNGMLRTIYREPMPWALNAACRGTDPDLFHPGRGEGSTTVAAAKAVCATCSVIAECRDYALRNKERLGVWGGLSGKQRKRIRLAS